MAAACHEYPVPLIKMKIRKLTLSVIAILSILCFAACGRSEFSVIDSTEKRMTITAENASREASFTTGSLEVSEGEQIVISSNLSKGSVRVEIIKEDEVQSISVLPDMDGEAVITANLANKDGASGTVPAGSYMVKATCLKKATGTIQIEVLPAS